MRSGRGIARTIETEEPAPNLHVVDRLPREASVSAPIGDLVSLVGRLQNAFPQRSRVVYLTAADRGGSVSAMARGVAFAAAETMRSRCLLVVSRPTGMASEGSAPSLPDAAETYLSREEISVASLACRDGTVHAMSLSSRHWFASAHGARRSVMEFYAVLRSSYDLIVVDCPPVVSVPFYAPIAASTPNFVLVVQFEGTPRQEALAAKIEIERIGGNLLGVVMDGSRPVLPRFIAKWF